MVPALLLSSPLKEHMCYKRVSIISQRTLDIKLEEFAHAEIDESIERK